VRRSPKRKDQPLLPQFQELKPTCRKLIVVEGDKVAEIDASEVAEEAVAAAIRILTEATSKMIANHISTLTEVAAAAHEGRAGEDSTLVVPLRMLATLRRTPLQH